MVDRAYTSSSYGSRTHTNSNSAVHQAQPMNMDDLKNLKAKNSSEVLHPFPGAPQLSSGSLHNGQVPPTANGLQPSPRPINPYMPAPLVAQRFPFPRAAAPSPRMPSSSSMPVTPRLPCEPRLPGNLSAGSLQSLTSSVTAASQPYRHLYTGLSAVDSSPSVGKPPPMMGIPFPGAGPAPMQGPSTSLNLIATPNSVTSTTLPPRPAGVPSQQRISIAGQYLKSPDPSQKPPMPQQTQPGPPPHMPGPTPHMPGPTPHMPGQTPHMPGLIPQLTRPSPLMPGSLPPMSGPIPPMPGPIPPMAGPTPPMPGPIPTMAGPTPPMPGPTPPMSGPTPPMPGPTPPMPGQIPPMPGSNNQPPIHHGVTGRREYPSMNTNSPQTLPPDTSANYTGGGGPPAPHHNPVVPGFDGLRVHADSARPLNLLEDRHVLPAGGVAPVLPNLPHDLRSYNCSPDIFRCTLTNIPYTQTLLQKSRLPFGILIHPFKDVEDLPVIQANTIVRCRSCRTYINPFVQFIDARRWKCNLCYRFNDLPDEFNYDPYTKAYQEPTKRPEICNGTIEFIAPAEYTLRPPQPAVYLYCLDVSRNALDTGYLQIFCDTLLKYFAEVPGDNRSQIGFITYDETLQFYNLDPELSQPSMLVVSDIEEILLPTPNSLLVNIQESMQLIKMLLENLVDTCEACSTHGNASAMGACLLAAYKLMSPTGGRITVVNSQLVFRGPGSLKCREDPNERASQKIHNLGPACDFYKRLALDCSTQQIAVDLFMINSSYADIATVGEVSRHSSGCIHYFPSFNVDKNKLEVHRFRNTLKRYFTRKIGFESVMRVRCSRGLEIEAFHGNFFVRSTNLLALANINPDAGFGAQLVIEDTIEANVVCLQAALLYTSSIGERRIRVHTICLPVTKVLSEIFIGADQQCIIGLVAKMGVKRSITSSITDAREAFVNVAVDSIESYCNSVTTQRMGKLLCPVQLRLVPVYILALLKCTAMRIGTSTKLDNRVMSLQQLINLPLQILLQTIHPDLYPVHMLQVKDNGEVVNPPILQLSSGNIDSSSAYIMDLGLYMYLWVGTGISDQFCSEVFGRENFNAMPECVLGISRLETKANLAMNAFIQKLNLKRAVEAPVIVMKEGSSSYHFITERMIEDRTQSTFSYFEFLQHIQTEIK